MIRSIPFAVRAAVAAVVMSVIVTSGANASFISTSPDPMLGSARVPVGGVPFDTPFGYANYYTTNYAETSNMVVGGNNIIDYTWTTYYTFYTTPAMTTVATSAVFQGQGEITVLGRTNPFETGPFNYQYNSLSLTGTVDGESVVSQLTPGQASGGTTTITAGPGLGQYTIDTPSTVYNQYSINGGAYVDVPKIETASVPLSAVPEPATFALLVPAIAGMLFMRWKRVA